jgi:hypothetical protein
LSKHGLISDLECHPVLLRRRHLPNRWDSAVLRNLLDLNSWRVWQTDSRFRHLWGISLLIVWTLLVPSLASSCSRRFSLPILASRGSGPLTSSRRSTYCRLLQRTSRLVLSLSIRTNTRTHGCAPLGLS